MPASRFSKRLPLRERARRFPYYDFPRRRIPGAPSLVHYQAGDPWLPQEQHYFQTGKSYNWQDELYQTAMVTNHDLNFRASKDFVAGSMGMSYYNETSPIPGQEFARYSLRGNLDLQMTPWLKAGMSTQNSFGLTYSRS